MVMKNADNVWEHVGDGLQYMISVIMDLVIEGHSDRHPVYWFSLEGDSIEDVDRAMELIDAGEFCACVGDPR